MRLGIRRSALEKYHDTERSVRFRTTGAAVRAPSTWSGTAPFGVVVFLIKSGSADAHRIAAAIGAFHVLVWWTMRDSYPVPHRTPTLRAAEETPMAPVPGDLKVCIFDVFGTVVDWRGSLDRRPAQARKKYGMDTDWTELRPTDWRGLLQPQMHRVRKGELPWTNIDELHKEAFEILLTTAQPEDIPARKARGNSPACGTSSAVARFGRGHRP